MEWSIFACGGQDMSGQGAKLFFTWTGYIVIGQWDLGNNDILWAYLVTMAYCGHTW